MEHILKVVSNVQFVLSKLNLSDDIIEAGKIAALLHDIGVINGKSGHSLKSYDMACEYLKDKSVKYKSEILSAIKNHSDSGYAHDIIGQALVFADKIDFDKERMLPQGKDVEYFNQIEHIEEVIVNLNNEKLEVTFVANDLLDKELLEEYYFISKIFESITGLANFLKIKTCVKINNDVWDYCNKQ